MNNYIKSILIIVGPTGIGKSDFAINLAQDINAEIINGDSRLVYKHFNIGTAKPSPTQLKTVKHHLIDILKPEDNFNISLFLDLVKEKIEEILSRQKTPIIVGGTGQYIKAILNDWTISKVPPNETLREELEEKIQLNGSKFVFKYLQEIDPVSAEQIDESNPRRIIRAIEIAKSEQSNSTSSSLFKSYSKIPIGLTLNRKTLYCRIDKRVEQMIEDGWVDEMKCLIKNNIQYNQSAMSSVGYKELHEYLIKDKYTLEEVIQKIKFRTHKLVRTQYNWFKLSDKNINWFESTESGLTNAKNFVISKLN